MTTEFDPQHDARFQRGYDPAVVPAADPAAALGVAATLPAEVPDSDAADFVRGTVGDEDVESMLSAPRRNPFVIALWVLGPLLIIGGFALVVQSASNNNYAYNGGEMPWGMILQQVGWLLAPAMLSTGLATMVGLLFWHAFAWHRARTAATEP